MMGRRMHIGLVTACGCLALTAAAQAADERVADGDFERAGLTFASTDRNAEWRVFNHGKADAKAVLAAGEGRGGSCAVRYTRAAAGSDNFHLDQLVAVESNAAYEASAWVRADGRLNPVLSVMNMRWKPLAVTPSNARTNWTRVSLIFSSDDNHCVRLEWFPGASGQLYEGGPGTSWLDEVSVTRLAAVPPELQRALDLTRSRKGEMIDVGQLGRQPVARRPRADTQTRVPPALMPITCRDGVLRYPDGGEVALWGVNLQTALSWEYNGRLKQVGVPLEAEALKRVADQNLDELVKMRATVIRMHLLPSDFSDAEGNVRDSVFLDALDYTVAGCRSRGLYVYLTLMNEMGGAYLKDSFMAGRDRREWIADPALADKSARYIRALLERENRYTRTAYKDEAAIAVFEIANEPSYVDFVTLGAEPMFAPLRQTFEKWCEAKGYSGNLELHYSVFRYEQVRGYLERMCGVIRGTGSAKPVIWNLNWPQMIQGHEDVFQAVADSAVDGISFCLYPGQHDVKHPYWAHPEDLSGRNYLPFLKRHVDEYERLGWALGSRFATKAKVVYEYETFFNQSSYLYPAMARLFRALGVQVAAMWTYSLTPAAEYMAGSHHLNLYCTPQKAASFAIAGEVLAEAPRYAPLAWARDDNLAFGSCAVSFTNNLSVWRSADTYMQSRATALTPGAPAAAVRHVFACGDSPYVTYGGTGIYTVEIGSDAVEIEISPDAEFVLPPWKGNRKGPWGRVCRLDSAMSHRFVLHHPGWRSGVSVWRIEKGQPTPVETEGGAPAFAARPGRYRIGRARVQPRYGCRMAVRRALRARWLSRGASASRQRGRLVAPAVLEAIASGVRGCDFTSLHRTQKSEFRSQNSELLRNDLHTKAPPKKVSPKEETGRISRESDITRWHPTPEFWLLASEFCAIAIVCNRTRRASGAQ